MGSVSVPAAESPQRPAGSPLSSHSKLQNKRLLACGLVLRACASVSARRALCARTGGCMCGCCWAVYPWVLPACAGLSRAGCVRVCAPGEVRRLRVCLCIAGVMLVRSQVRRCLRTLACVLRVYRFTSTRKGMRLRVFACWVVCVSACDGTPARPRFRTRVCSH